MLKDLEKLFACLKAPEPRAGLFDRIMNRIRNEQRLAAIKWRIALFSVGVAGSVTAFIPVFKMAKSAFSESGFMEFFSLFFSDLGAVASHWQNFISALLESLPVVSIVALLSVLFIFIGSLKFLTQEIKVVKGLSLKFK